MKVTWVVRALMVFVLLQLLLQLKYIGLPTLPSSSLSSMRRLGNLAEHFVSPTHPPPTDASAQLPPHLGTGNEETGCLRTWTPPPTVVAAVLVITCCRPAYLERTLSTLLEVHSRDPTWAAKFPIFVSQDGNNTEVSDMLRTYAPVLHVMEHRELREPTRLLNPKENLAYYRIANHYKFIFQQVFDCLGFDRLIVLEDDMEVSVDFFSFFQRMASLLAEDPTLYVVSSWNDHGQGRHVRDPYRLYRTDFFPGLGWMMPRALWDEFRDKWPAAYWDDWMREAAQRRGRQSVYPEVCRNYNFGRHGASKGQYFNKYLKPVRLNDVPVPWKDVDLGYLQPSRCAESLDCVRCHHMVHRRYAADLQVALTAATPVDSVHAIVEGQLQGDVKLTYGSEAQWRGIARALGILPEWKAGMPRSAYRGVVTLHWNEARVFIVPAEEVQAKMLQSEAAVARR